MKHNQEQLSIVLNKQWQRGYDDAMSVIDYGQSCQCKRFPSTAHPDITQSAAHDAYTQGFNKTRKDMGKQ